MIYLKIENFNNNNLTNLTIAEIGFIHLLEKYNNQGLIRLIDFNEYIDLENLKQYLIDLQFKSIIKYDLKIELDNFFFIVSQNKDDVIVDYNRIQKIFNLNVKQYQSIIDEYKDDHVKQLIIKAYHKYPINQLAEINISNKKEYLSFLKNKNPLQVLEYNQQKLKIKDFEKVYQYLIENKFEEQLISFAYDYAINNSIYNNLSYDYVESILINWQKKSITSIEDAMNYIEENKEKIINQKNKFVDPTYKKSENTYDQKKISKLINKEIEFE